MSSKVYDLLFLFFTVLIALAAAGCATTPTSPTIDGAPRPEKFELTSEQEEFAEALANFGVGVLRESTMDPGAITNYVRAVELQPDHLTLHVYAAFQHLRYGRNQEAINTLRDYSNRHTNSVEACIWLGKIAAHAAATTKESRESYLDQAETAFQRAIEIAPNDAQPYIHLASFYNAEQRTEDAEKLLRNAADSIPNPNDPLRMLSGFYYQQFEKSDGKDRVALNNLIEVLERADECPRDESSDDYLQQLAQAYLSANQPAKAVECYERLYKRNPGSYSFLLQAGRIYQRTGKMEKARKAFEAVLADGIVQYPEVYYWLAEIYKSQDKPLKAMEVYDEACQVYPEDPKPYLFRASLAADMPDGNPRKHLEAGLKAIPDSVAIMEMLATVCMDEELYDEAYRNLLNIYEISLKSGDFRLTSDFYLKMGLAAEGSGKPEKALSHFRKALELDPTLLSAYLHMSYIHADQDNPDAAVSTMHRAAERMPDNPYAYYYLGMVNSRTERYGDALSAYDKALELASKSAESDQILSADFYFSYGAAHEREHNIEKAEAFMEKAIQLDPEHSNAYNYLAYMWAEKGERLDEALRYVNKALKFSPDNAAFIDTLGWIYFKQKRYEEALEQIKKAAGMMPDDPTVTAHLGDIYEAMDNIDKALEYWQKSYMLDPSNKDVEKKLLEHGIAPGARE